MNNITIDVATILRIGGTVTGIRNDVAVVSIDIPVPDTGESPSSSVYRAIYSRQRYDDVALEATVDVILERAMRDIRTAEVLHFLLDNGLIR